MNLLGPNGKRPVLSWTEAAKLLGELNDGRAEPSPSIAAKAKALTEGAATEMDKIRALARFAQQVNYVSVQVNISKGGGYRPHDAAQVFEKLYGDCKDKANLLRALLKSVGITAYPVAIYSGDRTHVNQEWPSLGAFNHAISAIRVGAETKAAAVLDHAKLGRLLFFDPTDPHVAAGYLPAHEQASYALIAAGDAGDLVKVPAAAAVAGSLVRQVEATLKMDGSVEGSFVEKRTDESLSEAIASYRAMSKTDYVKAIERWVGRSAPGATASAIEVEEGKGEFVLKGKFASRIYAQIPQQRMIIFRAAVLRHGELRLTEKTRKYPIVLDTDALDETVKIALPSEAKVDELPDAVRLGSPYGKFEASWSVEADTLIFKRKLEIQAQTIPSAQFNELKKFLDRVNGSAESPVVLVKK